MKKNDVKNDSRKDNNLMVKIATFIVDKRRAFYLIFALALVSVSYTHLDVYKRQKMLS